MLYFLLLTTIVVVALEIKDKEWFCRHHICDEEDSETVCGIKAEEGGIRLKLFDSECLLLKYGCGLDENETYGKIDEEFCKRAFAADNVTTNEALVDENFVVPPEDSLPKHCADFDCSYPDDRKVICGIRKDGAGYRVKIFPDKCQMYKENCEKDFNFVITQDYICNGLDRPEPKSLPVKTNVTDYTKTERNVRLQITEPILENEDLLRYTTSIPETDQTAQEDNPIDKEIDSFPAKIEGQDDDNPNRENLDHDKETTEITPGEVTKETDKDTVNSEDLVQQKDNTQNYDDQIDQSDEIERWKNKKNVIVVDGSMLNFNKNRNINDTIDDFFASTHYLNLRLKQVGENNDMDTNDTRRGMRMRIVGPAVVFKPWIIKPKNVSDDYEHAPLLRSCFHACPHECPDSYAPVCGSPGVIAREPALMFQNHCYMDMAQCKMFRENKSPTAHSSAYIESSFYFCLGDQYSVVYRFLPLIRTLQHMGRLKKKGKYYYKIRNQRFWNYYLRNEPKFMGK